MMSNSKFVFITLVPLALLFTSCSNETNKMENNHSEMNHDSDHSGMNNDHETASNNMMDSEADISNGQQVLTDYLMLKDALVESNRDKAAEAGKKLESTLDGFDVSSYTSAQQEELNDIIADSKEHAEHISESEMDHQREHFKTLSKDIMDMIAITGTDNTMYEQFCPMYDGGSIWLSMEKDVKNPYYGSKMLTCGKVLKEIK